MQVLPAYAAHAAHGELVEWASALTLHNVHDIFLVHGEPEAQTALVELLRGAGAPRVRAPKQGEVFEL